MRSLSGRFEKYLTLLCVMGVVVVAVYPVYLMRGTVMGDAFIHFVFARGIALGEPFTYNGIFSAGSTSPLWSALLAPLWWRAGEAVIPGSQVMAGGCVGMAVVLLYGLVRRITGSRSVGLLAAGLLAVNGYLSWWAAKGMETPLALCLDIVCVWLYVRVVSISSVSSTRGVGVTLRVARLLELGVVLGLAILVRPEGWLLGLLLGVCLVVVWWRELGKVGWLQRLYRVCMRGLLVAVPAGVLVVPYYSLLYTQTGQVFPSSAARILHAAQWAEHTGDFTYSLEILGKLTHRYLPLTLAAVLGIYMVVRWRREWVRVMMPLVLWIGFHIVFFSLVMPTTQGERYMLPMVPALVVLACMGVRVLHMQSSRRQVGKRLRKPWGAWGVGAVVLVSMAVSGMGVVMERYRIITTCEVPYLTPVRMALGRWLQYHTDPGDTIAVKEVDQSAYYSGRSVVSMDGTLDRAAVPYVRSGDQLGYLRMKRPQYVVLEEEMYHYPDWLRSNLWPLIDADVPIGGSKVLGGMTFVLQTRLYAGDRTVCANLPADRPAYWYVYKIAYAATQ